MPANKRRLLQIHLSTAIVLMFVASALLWANVAHYAADVRYDLERRTQSIRPAEDGEHRARGWPLAFQEVEYYADRCSLAEHVQLAYRRLIVGNLIADLAVACIAIVLVTLAIEYPIRRRERTRKPPAAPFQVGDRVCTTYHQVGVVIRVDAEANHGLGLIEVRFPDGTECGAPFIGHDFRKEEQPSADGDPEAVPYS